MHLSQDAVGVRANDENIRCRLINEILLSVEELGSQRVNEFRLSLVSRILFTSACLYCLCYVETRHPSGIIPMSVKA